MGLDKWRAHHHHNKQMYTVISGADMLRLLLRTPKEDVKKPDQDTVICGNLTYRRIIESPRPSSKSTGPISEPFSCIVG